MRESNKKKGNCEGTEKLQKKKATGKTGRTLGQHGKKRLAGSEK